MQYKTVAIVKSVPFLTVVILGGFAGLVALIFWLFDGLVSEETEKASYSEITTMVQEATTLDDLEMAAGHIHDPSKNGTADGLKEIENMVIAAALPLLKDRPFAEAYEIARRFGTKTGRNRFIVSYVEEYSIRTPEDGMAFLGLVTTDKFGGQLVILVVTRASLPRITAFIELCELAKKVKHNSGDAGASKAEKLAIAKAIDLLKEVREEDRVGLAKQFIRDTSTKTMSHTFIAKYAGEFGFRNEGEKKVFRNSIKCDAFCGKEAKEAVKAARVGGS